MSWDTFKEAIPLNLQEAIDYRQIIEYHLLKEVFPNYKHFGTFSGTSNFFRTFSQKNIRYIPKLRESGILEVGCIASTTNDATSLNADANSAQAIVSVEDTTIFEVDDWIILDPTGTPEFGLISSINAGLSITLNTNLANAHSSGVNIYKCSQYSKISTQDSEHYRYPRKIESIIIAANLSSDGWYLEMEEAV